MGANPLARVRLTQEPCKVLFLGGPRHGNFKSFPRDPVIVGCVVAPTAKGLFGVYKSKTFKDGVVTMEWKELTNKVKAQHSSQKV
jgi:hypothetical protein